MRVSLATVMIAVSLGAWGCGSSTGLSGNPIAPTPAPQAGGGLGAPTPALPTDVVMIDVTSINGAQSFSPNPATVPVGHTVVWRNVDSVTHRVVLKDAGLDTGDIAPGASSTPVLITGGGGPYLCSIHPSMVGTVIGPSALSRTH